MARAAPACRFALVVLVAAMGRAVPAAAPAPASCLAYEPVPVAVQGVLHLQVFAGPPRYRSLDAGDQPEALWMLQLDVPLCIGARDGDVDSLALQDVRNLQIVPRTPLSMALNGHAARLEGTLSRPRSGHAHALLLLRTNHVEGGSAP